MKSFLSTIAAIALLAAAPCGAQQKVGHYVDPNIGGVAPLLTTVMPQVHRPNSMVRLFPVTEPGLADRYFSDRVYGIGLNMPLYRAGAVSTVMATTGALKSDARSCSSWYDHDIEELHPWYHRIYLDDFGVDAEWSATERSSIFRFTFPDGAGQGNLLFRLKNGGEIKVGRGGVVSGYENVSYARQYFYAVVEAPRSGSGTWTGEGAGDRKKAEGRDIGAWMSFEVPCSVVVRVGISYISEAQARENLERENIGKGFDEIVSDSERVWEDCLGRIRIEGGTERERRTFYTSLYRAFERMVDQSEYGRYYSGFDRQVHIDSRPFYNDDWNWDTYRNTHALQGLLDPASKADHLESYVRMYRQWGWVPNFPELVERRSVQRGLKEEPMIGNHTASVIAEAISKGITDFDIEGAYEGVRKNSLEGTMVPWRAGAKTELDDFYNANGYFPAIGPDADEPWDYVDNSWEKRQAVSVTLEHSYDDWCIAQIAKYLGKEDDYKLFMDRSRNYLNLWNPSSGYFSPKDADGNWIEPFDPELDYGYGSRGYFAEVNGCVHLFHVQHDIPRLISLMGGGEKFVERLDGMYNKSPKIGKWWFMGRMPDATGLQGLIPAGNEPAFHLPYLYNYAGAPWKAQHRVRQVCDVWFNDTPTGLSGDEDGGALTAWYVFSAMGFYPVNPASDEYSIVSPLFSRVEIDLPSGKKFTISAPGASKRNKYIRSARLNGKPLDRPFITHADIAGGGLLEFELVDKPDKTWGVAGSK